MADSRRERSKAIRDFVINNVAEHPGVMPARIVTHFGISRQSANSHIKKLVAEGVLDAIGKTRARQYSLKNFVQELYENPVSSDTREDVEWRKKILPFMENIPKNVVDICQYGFCEMVNNIVDHSESAEYFVALYINAKNIEIMVWDYGVGIFEKIQKDMNLDDPRHAMLELSKGKLTTDPERHTGEGIFFTSKMFDKFSIISGELVFISARSDDNWLVEVEDTDRKTIGTTISMKINVDSTHTDREVFEKYSDEDWNFSRTHVPLRLARYEGEQLVSRSQARRLLARIDRFSEVLLDFHGVLNIGQGFADEIFRVYHKKHPEIKISAIRITPEIKKTIARVTKDIPVAEKQSLLF